MPRIHILKGFSDIDSALWVLKYHPGTRSRSDLVQMVVDNGYTVTNKDYEIILLLTEWGLAQRKPQELTQKGVEFYRLWERNQSVAIDVLHGLQYGVWTRSPDQNLASWTYQQVCDYLWEYQTLPPPQNLVDHIYGRLDVLNERLEALNKSPIDIGNAAFDTKSVNGAYDWLSSLSVFEGVRETTKGKNFRNATLKIRDHCSTVLFLMGLDWVAREAGNEYGDLWSIGPNQKRQVCRFCLIDGSQFDFMFNETLRRFPNYLSVRPGTYVVIGNEPQIADF